MKLILNDRYSITESGKVWSHRTARPRLLRDRAHRTGYRIIMLYLDGKQKLFYIHRLVAKAYIENPLNKREVNHINGDKTDNRVENLEWVTPSENMRHAFRTGLIKHPGSKGTDFASAKLTDEAVREIRACYVDGKYTVPMLELCKRYGVSKATISRIQKGVRWTHVSPSLVPPQGQVSTSSP